MNIYVHTDMKMGTSIQIKFKVISGSLMFFHDDWYHSCREVPATCVARYPTTIFNVRQVNCRLG